MGILERIDKINFDKATAIANKEFRDKAAEMLKDQKYADIEKVNLFGCQESLRMFGLIDYLNQMNSELLKNKGEITLKSGINKGWTQPSGGDYAGESSATYYRSAFASATLKWKLKNQKYSIGCVSGKGSLSDNGFRIDFYYDLPFRTNCDTSIVVANIEGQSHRVTGGGIMVGISECSAEDVKNAFYKKLDYLCLQMKESKILYI